MSLSETIIANSSNISTTAIGERDDEALLCFTDLNHCCSGADEHTLGGWYFPNKFAVGDRHSGNGLYLSRGPSVLRLHRKNDVTMPVGVFRCLIPDASGITQNVHIQVTNNGIPLPPTTFSTFIVVSAAVPGVLLVIVVVLVIAAVAFGIARYNHILVKSNMTTYYCHAKS